MLGLINAAHAAAAQMAQQAISADLVRNGYCRSDANRTGHGLAVRIEIACRSDEWHVPGDRGDIVIGTRDERFPAVAAIARPFVGILVNVPAILANELHKSGLGWMDSVP